jgi:hypothetical protein
MVYLLIYIAYNMDYYYCLLLVAAVRCRAIQRCSCNTTTVYLYYFDWMHFWYRLTIAAKAAKKRKPAAEVDYQPGGF